MIALLDTSADLRVAEKEIGVPCEQLITPLTSRARQDKNGKFAIDNGAFGKNPFDRKAFIRLLDRHAENKEQCRFVVVPDVVCNARRTIEVFHAFKHEFALRGWKLALAAQNGCEDLDIPWADLHAIFIAGDDAWKLGPDAADVIRAAIALGKWVHIGRVNTPERYHKFNELGANSFDGTGISQYSDMRFAIRDSIHQPSLFSEVAPIVDGEMVSVPSVGLVGAAAVLDSAGANAEG